MQFSIGNLSIILVIVCLSLISLALFVYFTISSLYKEKSLQRKYTLLNTFPSELNGLITGKNRLFTVYSFLFFSICMMCATIAFNLNLVKRFSTSVNYLGILLLLCSFVEVIFLVLMVGFSIFYPKRHILFTTLYFAFSILKNLLSCSYGFYYHNDISAGYFSISFGTCIVYLIIAIIQCGLIINPKLANWAKKNKTEQDGATYFVRPKVNFLCLTEWIFLLMSCINLILILVDSSLGFAFII